MSLKFLFANNVRSHLAAPITTTDTAFTVTAGDGAMFPSPVEGNGERVALTIVDDLGNMEIVYVTKRTTDTFTVVRAQEGTTAKEFAENAIVELRITAASLNQISVVPPVEFGTVICLTPAGNQSKSITVDNFSAEGPGVLYVEFYMGNTNSNMYLIINGIYQIVINPQDTVTGEIRDMPYPVIMFVREYDGWRAYNPIASAKVESVTYGTTLSTKKLLISDVPTISNGHITFRSIDALTVSKENSSSPLVFKVDGQVTATQFNGNLNGHFVSSKAIDGINYNGSAPIVRLVICDTPADVPAKVVSVPNITANTDGTILYVKFTNGNTASVDSLTLDVGYGANPIKWKTSNVSNHWISNRELIVPLINYNDIWWVIGYPDLYQVYQVVSNTSADSFPLLFTNIANLATNRYAITNFNSGIVVQPSTKTITASTFNGTATNAVNATNATKWGGANKYISTAGPSGGVHGDVWFQYI